MVPKIHAKGTSFKGAAAYLLHDKNRAETSDRVEWVEMRNLITDDPETGWRVMAATAMDQDRLKTMAGVKSTGRKSNASVLHLTLAWHPDEKAGLSREEMLRSAMAAIRALEAGDRQAMIICHSDEEHPHIHVLINRVSPQDGKMLSSSKEKLNLSKWAEGYEKERGQIYCEERVLNNEARSRGHYKRGTKNKARHIYEKESANDNKPDAQNIRSEQRSKDAAVAKTARATKERHRQQWQELRTSYRQRAASIRAQHLLDTAKAKDAVRARFRPDYQMLFHEHQAEQVHFLKNEKTFLGRAANALRAIDFKALVGGRAIEPERKTTLSQAFDALSSSGARLEAMKQRHARQKRELEGTERKAENAAAQEQRAGREAALKENRAGFEKERSALILTQRMEGAKHRTDWKTRNEQRAEAWQRPEGKPQGQDGHKPRDQAQLERARQLSESFRQRKRGFDRGKDTDRERGD